MFSVSSETLRDVRGVCNVVTMHADVPNVVVVHGMGLIEDLGSADNPACWEFLVVCVC